MYNFALYSIVSSPEPYGFLVLNKIKRCLKKEVKTDFVNAKGKMKIILPCEFRDPYEVHTWAYKQNKKHGKNRMLLSLYDRVYFHFQSVNYCFLVNYVYSNVNYTVMLSILIVLRKLSG